VRWLTISHMFFLYDMGNPLSMLVLIG
jgi:hypothetical protein